ncbi:ABC transporter [Amycolatopsis antarctica]|uniref:ABC transporter n=1 Tax=Amycolatopsis antarctica TaxID=1854586 RepID=A0A263D4S0_9PSEU|nr:ABC transporter [Amycolatopsis antarctica]
MAGVPGRPHVGAAGSPEPVVLSQVTKTYGRGEAAVQALRGVTIGFSQGTFTAVMGPSGSGKSTLLQCAAGLDTPSDGHVRITGSNISDMSEVQLAELRRDRIGFIFQAFNLVPSLTAEQNVELPLRLAGRKPAKRDVRSALSRVGLDRVGKQRPSQLSGGQQQRVAIARALITRPEVLFADEPTGALDTNTSGEVLTLLRETVERAGQTTIMVTHDPVAAAYADRVIFLADGHIVGHLDNPTAKAVIEQMTRLEG